MSAAGGPLDTASPTGIRQPLQARSAETLDRLLGAAESLFVRDGAGSVTVQAVVNRAGSSVGSFYARFDGRDALLRCVQERFWKEAEERWRDYFAGERIVAGSPLRALARFTRALVRAVGADRDRLRAFLLLALSEPELGLDARTAALDDFVVEGAGRLLEDLDQSDRSFERQQRRREVIRCILASSRDAVLFRTPTPAQESELILSLVIMAAAGAELGPPPSSYSELLRLCRAGRRGRESK